LSSAIRNYALLFTGCVLFHVIGTWSLPLIDRDEPRFAEASREMIERGNYVVPYFNNQYRFDKPPLTYWAQVASYKAFGENDFAARFPSAVAGALIALSIFAWGSRLRVATASQARVGGSGVGWWAAMIFTLSLQVFAHGKAAVADMWLVLFVTMAHWAGWELIQQQKTLNAQRSTLNVQWGWWTAFYVSIALGFLAKGPIAFVPLLTAAAMKWQDRQVQLGKRFAFVRGIAFTLAIIALWAVPAYMQTHGEFLRVGIGRHVIARSFGAMEGHGGSSLLVYLLLIPFYFVTIFASFFPWSIKLPWLMNQARRSRDRIDNGADGSRATWTEKPERVGEPGGESINYLLGGSALVFLVFTLVSTKLPHYTLPAFPLLALLLARQLAANQFPAQRFKTVAIATAAVWICIAFVAPPLVAPKFPAKALFEAAQNDLRPEMEFGVMDFNEPSLVWYFRSRVKGWMTQLDRETAMPFMEKPGARFAIIPTNLLADVFPNRPPAWKTYARQGFNVAKGKRADLTLVLKPE
jgi:4-amino-4-deoxy-L-arabinose transferase-like glycosyltransferase